MTPDFTFLDDRPIIIALGGSNGAGKSTFYHAHLANSGLRFINADVLASEMDLGAYEAADAAAAIRQALVLKKESFIFETVLSDPVGDKVAQLGRLAEQGYQIVLIFIQIPDARVSIERVSMRVSQGGHDVPDEKLLARFARTEANLKRAIEQLTYVLIYDNSDLARPFRLFATYHEGKLVKGEAG